MNKLKTVAILSTLVASMSANAAVRSDEFYMKQALVYAKKNPKSPFGAVIVNHDNGKILCGGVNNTSVNPTYHGEMVAINQCAKKYPHLDWSHTTLYTTAEPCPMCQSAIVWAGISRTVFATPMDVLKSNGWQQINIPAVEVNAKSAFYNGTIKGGVLAEETNPLFVKKK